jgi:hypothetical protein
MNLMGAMLVLVLSSWQLLCSELLHKSFYNEANIVCVVMLANSLDVLDILRPLYWFWIPHHVNNI